MKLTTRSHGEYIELFDDKGSGNYVRIELSNGQVFTIKEEDTGDERVLDIKALGDGRIKPLTLNIVSANNVEIHTKDA